MMTIFKLTVTVLIPVLCTTIAVHFYVIKRQQEHALNKALAEVERLNPHLPEVELAKGLTHETALAIATEIARLENNLFLMAKEDIRRRHMARAVDNMKACLRAEGYEMAELIGRSYDEGMDASAVFIHDEKLAKGDVLVVSVQKPVMFYKGKRIQSGHVTVGRNLPIAGMPHI